MATGKDWKSIPFLAAGILAISAVGPALGANPGDEESLWPSPKTQAEESRGGERPQHVEGQRSDSFVLAGDPSERDNMEPRVFSNGLRIDGPFSFTIDNSGVDMSVAKVVNGKSSGTSGTLELWLWATTFKPIFGQNNPGYKLASWRPSSWHGPNGDRLRAGFSASNIVLNNLPYSPPPSGCYYISVMLVEQSGSQFFYQDFFVFPQSPYGISGGSCGGGGVQPCSQNLSQGVICLRNGRFELSMTWTGFDFQTNPVVFKKSTEEVALGVFQNNTNDVTLSAKVTNGCPVNGKYWVWLGAFTASKLDLTVRDTVTGQSKNYGKSLGGLMTTIKDDFTFPCN